MKKLLYLLLFISFPLYGTNYYVSNAGSNDNNGTSSGTPWQTLSKVNASTFVAGDNIYFRCGDIFRGYLTVPNSGTSSNRITFGSYGAGVKPQIVGAVDRSSTSHWTNYSGNVWRTAALATAVGDMGNVIFNNDAAAGKRELTLDGVNAQGDYFFNTSEERVYLYSASNPGTYYTHIEVGGVWSENVVTAYDKDYLVFDNLHIKYSANNGFFLHDCTNITITDCEVSWIGGMWWGDDARMGNGIQMWNNASNFTITRNYIHDIYDTGISPQGEGTYTQQNLNIHHNLLKNCNWTYEVFCNTTRTLTNVDFCNNTCLYAGNTWSANQRVDAYNARHVRTWGENGTLSGNDVKNNIFYYSTQTAYAFYYNSPFILDYNLFYVNTIGYINTTSYSSLASWRTATGMEAYSISADPQFNSDYTLKSTSPAIDKGTNLGYTTDYLGNPIIGAHDIGACEYQGASYEDQYVNLVIEGHSFVAPGTTSQGYLLIPAEADVSTQHNVATGGAEIETVSGRAYIVDGYLVTESTNLQNVLVLWIGVNDLSYFVGEGATHYALLKTYVQARVAAGWTVFAYTITPSDAYGRGAQFEVERQSFNNLMRTDLAALSDVFVLNTDAVPELVDIDNATYWPPEGSPPGALHPSAAAMALATDLFGNALAEFWSGEEPPEVITDSGIIVSGGKIVVNGSKIVVK